MSDRVLGIDLGGTTIKLRLFLQDGTCIKSISAPTPQPANPKPVVEAIASGIKQLNYDLSSGAIALC